MSGIITFLVSERHAEYPLRGVTVEHVWSPCSDDLLDITTHEDATTETLAAEFARRAGAGIDTIAEPYPGYADEVDLTWENIIRVSGTAAEIIAAWTTLIADLAEPPSGDDSTFDYWPSGVLLARAIAGQVGADLEPVEEAVHQALDEPEFVPFLDELYEKVGFTRPENTTGRVVTITLQTGNDAFRDSDANGVAVFGEGSEVDRLLRRAVAAIVEGGPGAEGSLRDVNGNTVGSFSWE